jgi:hypothetical protein
MNTTTVHPKKSPASKARRKSGGASVLTSRSLRVCTVKPAARGDARPTHRRSQTAATKLPTQIERDTLLTPEWVAESVVQEVERFLNAHLPDNFAERLAAKAQHLYPRHQHFHKGLNRPGNRGRENLLMFMRRWTAGWLKRERNPLHKKLPYSFGMGKR